MISPDGQSGDVPSGRVHDAVNAGFKTAVVMTAPDGKSTGYIPHDRAMEAIKAGFKIGPASQQDTSIDHPPSVVSGLVDEFKQGVSSPEGYKSAVQKNIQTGKDFDSAVGQDVKALATSPSTYLGPAVAGGYDAAKKLWEMRNGKLPAEPDLAHRAGEALGINTEGVDEASKRGSYGGVIGHAALPLAMVKAAGETPVGEQVKGAADAAIKTPYEVSKAAWEARRVRTQVKTMDEAAVLPPKVVQGVEDVFRASAPTGMNKGFRENVYAAAGDLAEIARKVDISESRGGAVRPDMRIRATVDAIGAHLDEMYQQERAPQIKAHADAPVDIPLGDATRGLEFIKRSGGTLADQALAEKAIKTGTLTLEEADKLAQTANQYLKSFESMTASEKLEAISKTPKIGGLKALDVALGKNMNEVLTQNGEVGLRSYERRYAALSEVRDQLESRMNADELKRAMPLSGFVRSLAGGKAGIASASQAAVANVNIGRRLQNGLMKLKDSGITAQRD